MFFHKIHLKRPAACRRTLAILAAVLCVTCLGVNIDDVLYVKRSSIIIRNGKFAFDKPLATALQGETLTVEEVKGGWLKVRYTPRAIDANNPPADVVGYVFQDALSARPVAAATTRQTGSAAEVGSAGAGRGLLNAIKYASAKGLSPDSFYKIVTDSREVMKDADDDFQEFEKTAALGWWRPASP